MKTWMGRFAAIMDQVRTWGMVLPRATGHQGAVVQVYGPGKNGALQLVGRLWQEGGEFLFRYDSAFVSLPDAEPISAFPQLDETYRSTELWAFFAVRIPPLRRADVKELLERLGIKAEQTLEVLGALAGKSPTNPYELRLEKQTVSDPRRDPPASAVPPSAMHSAT